MNQCSIIAVVGKSGSGKTTLVERIVFELTRRGYRIGTAKHASHGFEMDRSGKDSQRHKSAGSKRVFVISPSEFAMLSEESTDSLDMVVPHLNGLDLLIAEGFKSEEWPKIEIVREARSKKPMCLDDPYLIALVTDVKIASEQRLFGLDQIDAICDFIESEFILNWALKRL